MAHCDGCLRPAQQDPLPDFRLVPVTELPALRTSDMAEVGLARQYVFMDVRQHLVLLQPSHDKRLDSLSVGSLSHAAALHAQARVTTRSPRGSPGVPTPYRAMMRHLLGGDYHSPGAPEAWSPARDSPARSQQLGAASERSPAMPIAASGNEEGLKGLADQDSSTHDQHVLASADVVQPSASAMSSCRSAGEEQPPARMQQVAIAPAVRPEAVTISADEGLDASSPAQRPSTPDEAVQHNPAEGEQPSAATTVEQSQAPADAPTPTAAAKQAAATHPLSAIPARLQTRALTPTPGIGDSPGAGCLVASPGSEIGTPTQGEEALKAALGWF